MFTQSVVGLLVTLLSISFAAVQYASQCEPSLKGVCFDEAKPTKVDSLPFKETVLLQQSSRVNALANGQREAQMQAMRASSSSKRFPFDVMTCLAGEPVLKTRCANASKYDAVSETIQKLYFGLPDNCDSTSCPQADWAGCVLRIAGHDFMDFDPTGPSGGSDGCIDFDDTDNKGLETCLYEGEFGVSLYQAYQEHCLDISLADFFVISAEAIMSATRSPGSPPLDFRSQFQFGRRTAVTCDFTQHLPDPEKGCDDVDRVFVQNMGLSWRESAALLGVHSLGRAQKKNSGYDGWWSDPANSRIFNNNYYVSIIAKGWRAGRTPASTDTWTVPKTVQEEFKFMETAPNKIQWARFDHNGNLPESTRHEMMLNTDLCLAFANGNGEPVVAARDECCTWAPAKMLKVDQEIIAKIVANNDYTYCGESVVTDDSDSSIFKRYEFINHKACCHDLKWENCGVEENQGAPTSLGGPAEQDVLEFAADESAWLDVFLPAWKKATENGQELRPLGQPFGECRAWCHRKTDGWKTRKCVATPQCFGCPECCY